MNLVSAVQDIFSTRQREGELSANGALDRLAGLGLVIAAALYIWFDILGGPIRGILGGSAATLLLYLPAAVAIPALLTNALVRIGDPRTSTTTLTILAFIAVEFVLALMLGRRAPAALFALYIFMPALVLMSLAQRRMQDRAINMMFAAFFVAVVGVLINIFVRFPWADATFEVAGMQQAATREWSAGGMSRLAGFSRVSYYAAAQILLGYCVVEHRVKSLVWRGIWWMVGLVAVYYTTSKAPFLAMLLLPGTYFLIGRARATDAARRQQLADLMMGFWVFLIFIGPLIARTYGPRLYPQGMGVGRSYSSLADRILNTWPNALAMVDWRNPVSWIVGRGIGGIGTPSRLFEPPGNPGDNLGIYLYVAFGLVTLVFAYLVFRGGHRAIAAGGRGRRDFALIVAMLGIGTAANVIEGAFPAMIFGLALARPAQRLRRAQKPAGSPRSRRRRRSGQHDGQGQMSEA